jgi:uncharacterized protein
MRLRFQELGARAGAFHRGREGSKDLGRHSGTLGAVGPEYRVRFETFRTGHVTVVAPALVLPALLLLALVLLPEISSSRGLEADPCDRSTVTSLGCVAASAAASEYAKPVVMLPPTESRPVSDPGLSLSLPAPLVEQHQAEPRIRHTAMYAEQRYKTRAAGFPLLPDVLKPQRPHPRPARPIIAAHGTPGAQKEYAPTKPTDGGESQHTVGIVTGSPQSTEFTIAYEIADSLATGHNLGPHDEATLRILPMVGDSGIQTITDVLTLPDADMAIVPVSLVDRFRDERQSSDIQTKLVYIALLFPEEFHVLASAEISSMRDLDGKVVNLGEDGSAAAVLGREICADLGINVKEAHVDLDAAVDGMRKGEISAAFLVSGKPVRALASLRRAAGFHFLAIPFMPNLNQKFLPSVFTYKDYPYLVSANERVDTVAVLSALISYNWPRQTERFRRLELFAQFLFSQLPDFQTEAHHPKWREVSLAATLPGWTRFRPTEGWTQRR